MKYRAMISRISWKQTKNLDHITELSSVLFGGISCSFLPYSERQGIVINHYILSKLTWGLPHKRSLNIFLLWRLIEMQWLQYTQSLNLYQMKSHKNTKTAYICEKLESFVF